MTVLPPVTIREALGRAVRELGLPEAEFAVEHPREEAHGDYSANIAMALYGNSEFRIQNSETAIAKSPRELAEKIVTVLQNDTQIASLIDTAKISVAGPGFINFTLNQTYLGSVLATVLLDGARFGQNTAGEGKLAIVEYSSPNIAKPFTIGHLRSTVIGDAVANLLEMNGWRVLRDNHLGDWGTQFGKQICAIKHWGNMQAIATSKHPVKELVALYVKFHEEAEKDSSLEDEARGWFKKLEDGDKEARQIWQECIDYSWIEFKRIYDLLGVHHSQEFNGGRGLGESFFENKMGAVIAILKEKHMLKEGKEGAQLVFFPDDLYPPAMILKKDGATLYHTRDLATDKYRLDVYKPDLVINEVGAEQQLYFQQLYEMEKMLGWYTEGQRVHVMHGMYRFADGKMSTRKGNVIWLEEVLEEAVKRASKLGKVDLETARAIGIGALKWNDLRGETKRDIVFDWDKVLSMQGDSGPYIQYTYARAESVLRKANNQSPITNHQTKHTDNNQKDSEQLGNLQSEEVALLRWLYRYPEVVAAAGRQYAPHLVAQYIYELAARFNTFYNKHQIIDREHVSTSAHLRQGSGGQARQHEIMQFRVELTEAVAQVLASGLGILGIAAPSEM